MLPIDFVFGSTVPLTHQVVSTDNLSYVYGDQSGTTFCGARHYEVVTSDVDFVTIDASTGLLSVFSDNNGDVGLHKTITVSVHLAGYSHLLSSHP